MLIIRVSDNPDMDLFLLAKMLETSDRPNILHTKFLHNKIKILGRVTVESRRILVHLKVWEP